MYQNFLNFFKKLFFEQKDSAQKVKLAIILSGGGMKCAYTAGFLFFVKDYLKNIPHFIIAASGSSGNASYYASGQYDVGRKVWFQEISVDEMLYFKRKKMLDVDYLVDRIFKQKYPLQISNLQNSNIQVFLPAICFETGEIKYFDSYNKSLNWFEVLRAANALPFFYNKKIKIGELHYLDSMYSSSWQAHISKALQEGATHFLIVDLSGGNPNGISTKIFNEAMINFSFKSKKNNYSMRVPIKKEYMKRNNFVQYITPSVLIGTLENNQESLQKMWQAGFDDSMYDLELLDFLKNLHKNQ